MKRIVYWYCLYTALITFKSIDQCIIRNCNYLKETTSGFCYECDKYPCKRLKQLDIRYRTRDRMSMTDNLNSIKSHGLEWFAESEDLRWTCRNCGATICVHRENCQECGKTRIDLANRRNVG